MKQVVIAALIVAWFVPIAARADLEKGDFAPDLDATDWLNTDGRSISISELRGMIVVLYFWESWQSGGRQVLRWSNWLENQARGAGVFIIGVTSADRRAVEELVKKEHIFFPIALGCARAGESYKITQYPRVVVLDPNGAVAYSGLGNVQSEVEKLLDDAPPFRTHPREAEKAHKALAASREALKKGDYREAFIKAREADEYALTDDPLRVRCQEMLDLIDAIGRDRALQGLTLVDRREFEQGVQVITEVLEQFQVAGCGKAARRRMRSLKEHYPEVQRAADKIGREDQAQAKLSEAAEKLWRRRFGLAYEALKKIETDYADTKAAETAKLIRGRMDANASLAQRVVDEQARGVCEERLSRARSLISVGRHDEARRLLRSIIDEFPNTRYREDAYQLLSEIP